MSQHANFDFVTVPTFYEYNNRVTVAFRPVTDTPGYTHRVIINGVATRDWLGDHVKPSQKAAAFFLEKYLKNR